MENSDNKPTLADDLKTEDMRLHRKVVAQSIRARGGVSLDEVMEIEKSFDREG